MLYSAHNACLKSDHSAQLNQSFNVQQKTFFYVVASGKVAALLHKSNADIKSTKSEKLILTELCVWGTLPMHLSQGGSVFVLDCLLVCLLTYGKKCEQTSIFFFGTIGYFPGNK